MPEFPLALASPRQSAPASLRVCHAPDGVRLAMAVQGQGPVVVKAAQWLSHLQQEPLLFATRHWLAELSRANTLVSCDSRGCGLSDRDVPEVSLQGGPVLWRPLFNLHGLTRLMLPA